jgi:hypothetical protein
MAGLESNGFAMERWVLIGGVLAIFLGLAAMGWHYQQRDDGSRMCDTAETHCGEQHM